MFYVWFEVNVIISGGWAYCNGLTAGIVTSMPFHIENSAAYDRFIPGDWFGND